MVRAAPNSEHRIERIKDHRGIAVTQQALRLMHLKKLLTSTIGLLLRSEKRLHRRHPVGSQTSA